MNANDILSQLKELAARPMEQATSLPAEIYRNDDILAKEKDAIFKRDWICPGLAAEIPKAGDYITHSIAGQPVFCIRDSEGEVQTYSNVCRHRMMQLLEGKGHSKRVVCPYHAWTYDLKGQLIGAPYMDRSEGFDKKQICLPKIRTEIWNGWIYITLNEDAPSVAKCLAELDADVGRYNMAGYVPVLRQEHVWKTNWKLLTENFMEGYHLPVAHKATVGAWIEMDATKFPDQCFEYFTYQSYKKAENATYGCAHRDNTVLEGEWRNTSLLLSIFPTHMYVLAPDHLWYLSLRPHGAGEVMISFGVAIAPEVDASLDDREAWMGQLEEFFDHVNTEDKHVVEGIYAGSKSDFAVPGQLSWLEREIHDFQKYLASRLTS